ncbi:DUF2905 family protein [bacterium 3DAC]|jgi:hypothetical protein|nr:DUF2905 domain-containing protein [Dictyoglomota bacterium]UZN22372.1 DUF2905 family protein [bacterium 3DAC]
MYVKVADMLIVVGLLLIILGLVWKAFPMLGRLPGDIVIKGDGYSIYIPIVSSIIVSVLLTVVLNIIIRLLGGSR